MFERKVFATRLSAVRTMRGMSQLDLSEASGLSRATIAAYELGRNSPTAESLCVLADSLGCSTDFLLGKTVIAGMF